MYTKDGVPYTKLLLLETVIVYKFIHKIEPCLCPNRDIQSEALIMLPCCTSLISTDSNYLMCVFIHIPGWNKTSFG